MKERIRSVEGLFGTIIHYDSSGRYVGESRPGLLDGEYNHYSIENGYEGYSTPGITADMIHHDYANKPVAYSIEGPLSTTHYSDEGYIGSSYEDDWGSTTYIDFD